MRGADEHLRDLLGEHAERRLTAGELARIAVFTARLAWRADRRRTAGVLVLQVVHSLGLGVGLLVLSSALGRAMDLAGGQERTHPGELALPLGVLLVLGFVGGVLGAVVGALQPILALKVQRDATRQMAAAATSADLMDFERAEFHDRLQRSTWAAELHVPMLLDLVVSALRAALTVVGLGVALVVLAWWLLPLLLVAALPLLRVALANQRGEFALQLTLIENHRARAYFLEVLTGRDEAKEVRAFGLTEVLTRKLEERFAAAIEKETEFHRRFAVRRVRARLASDGALAVTVAGLVVASSRGWMPLASGLSALGGVYLVANQVAAVTGMSSIVGGSVRYVDDLRRFTAGVQASPGEPSTGGPFEVLEARGVGFSYRAGVRPPLEDVSLRVEAGEVIALVGRNGSGKTTLAKILTGLYAPAHGRLVVDGDDVDRARLRAGSAVVFQDFLRFKLSARDNIGMGRPDQADDHDRIVEAARQAGAHDFIEALPRGYDTVLSTEFSDGSDLSLGQWQRIALARAFFRDAPFVVLDEPTAALDPRAEADLFRHIRELLAGRTVLLISHRFSSVRSADRIYVLDEGRVVEHGTHDELMAEEGTYAELFLIQAAAYLHDGRHNATRRRSPV